MHVRLAVTSEGKQETASHDLTADNVWRPVGIYAGAPIEQVGCDTRLVDDDHRLSGTVEIDDVTSNKVLENS